MGPATYYAPLWLGTLVAAALYLSLADPKLEAVQHAWRVVLVAPGFGLACQVAMFGAQGAFAQVLPVPRGRSIRGRSAVVAGWLLLAYVGAGFISVYLYVEEVRAGAGFAGAIHLACGLIALGVYVWNIPAAARDFDTGTRGA